LTITTYEFSPKDLDDLINGIPTDEFIELYIDFSEEGHRHISIDSFMTPIYDNITTPEDIPWGSEGSDLHIIIYLDNYGTYWESSYNYTKDREYISTQELLYPSLPPFQGPLDY